jgi:hypothetical protein
MLKDIVAWEGDDLVVKQSEAERAGNILATQIGSLEYAPTMGIDLKYFLESEFNIQNASFQAYMVQRLLEQRVNVVQVVDVIERLATTFIVSVGSSEQSEGNLIS